MGMVKSIDKICNKINYKHLKNLFLLVLLPCISLLGGCGHLVTGYSSFPYLESKPLQLDGDIQTGIPKSELFTLGAKVSVKLWNDFFTSEPEAKIFNKTESGSYVMLLQITPETEGLRLEPMAVKLTIDGKTYLVKTYNGSETDMRLDPPRGRQRKFSAWDGRSQSETKTSNHAPMILTKGCFYTLTIEFDSPKPNPNNNIAVDISSALKGQADEVAERILFKKVQWQEMHQ